MSAPGRPKRELVPRGGTARSAKGAHIRVPAPWLETLRLEMREFVPGDIGDLVRLDSDPRVMKYIGNGRTTKPADVASVMRRVARVYQIYPGLGTWRAARRDTGAFIGWFTLKYIPGTVEVEVGYRLLHEAWGQGFATEGATALVQYGFDDLGLDRIIGITHKDNLASQRVLTKAGLKSRGWGTYYGWRVRLFEGLREPALSPTLSRGAGEGVSK